MERKRPKIQNKVEIPVNIFKGENLFVECPCIQEAARFLKETNSKRFNWSAINKGTWYGGSHSVNGTTYFSQPIQKLLRENWIRYNWKAMNYDYGHVFLPPYKNEFVKLC